ncbi:MAG TPA: hypothetical protein VK933_04500 [Longimicrobiales bacterium]|nr:hypothetical protein [Longimicrobiales bacterium]
MQINPRFIALMLAVAAASACSTDSIIDPSDRPDPPPAEAFDLDLSFFDETTPAPNGATTAWAQALQTVAAAQSDMAMLEVTEALLRAAASATATRQDQHWSWPFSTTIDGDPYDGRLRSTVAGNEYEWNLFVTAPQHSPQLSDYLWAQGYTQPGNDEGLWWLVDAEAGTDTIVAAVSWFRNLEDGINFGFSDSDSTRWMFERASAGNVLTWMVFNQPRRRITWFPASGTGQTWTSATNNACWDENQHDIAC